MPHQSAASRLQSCSIIWRQLPHILYALLPVSRQCLRSPQAWIVIPTSGCKAGCCARWWDSKSMRFADSRAGARHAVGRRRGGSPGK